MAYYIAIMDILGLSALLMQIGLGVRLIEGRLPITVSLLVETWYPGKARNKMWYPDAMQNLKYRAMA